MFWRQKPDASGRYWLDGRSFDTRAEYLEALEQAQEKRLEEWELDEDCELTWEEELELSFEPGERFRNRTSRHGLMSPKGEFVALERVVIGGEIVREHARLTVKQTYRNVEVWPIEAIYVFPLAAEAVLAGFRVSIDGRELHGELRPREAASEAYQEAVAAGHGAALLERERPGVHTLSLGNILPGSTVEVELELLLRLEVREGETRLKIPTIVAPRYIPGVPLGGRTGDGVSPPTDRVPDADRITPPVGEAPYRLDLDIELLESAATTVESPSHRVVVREVEGRRRLAFEAPGEPLDRDLVLIVREAAPSSEQLREATAWVSARRGERTVAIALGAPAEERPVEMSALDIALVVDVSGSMEGASLEQAKRAARLCLRQLRRGDRVYLLEFDTDLYAFSRRPVAWSPLMLERADRWIEQERGGGGTELGRALEAAVAALGDSPEAAVLVITDGQVGQEEEIYHRLTVGKRAPRITSIGVGTNVVGTLLERLAKATGGAVEEIHPGERIEPKVVAQLARLGAGAWRDVKPVALPEGLDCLAPAPPWTLVEGETTTLFARLGGPLPKRLELEGRFGAETRRWSVELRLAPKGVQPVLARFHAALRVRELEEKLAALQRSALAPGTAGKRAQALRKQLETLSIDSGILSTATAWVAIEERAEQDRTDGLPATRVVPISAPAGWAMFGEVVASPPNVVYRGGAGPARRAPAERGEVTELCKVMNSAEPMYFEPMDFEPMDSGEPPLLEDWSHGEDSVPARSHDLLDMTCFDDSTPASRRMDTFDVLVKQRGDGFWGERSAPEQARLVETLSAIESLLEAVGFKQVARRALERAAEALVDLLERQPDWLMTVHRDRALALVRRIAEKLELPGLLDRVLESKADPDSQPGAEGRESC